MCPTKAVFSTPRLGSCDFYAVGSGQLSVPEALSYYQVMRAYVEHEDGLINSRLTWSLTVHGFLFAIYGILLGKSADTFIELHKLAPPASPMLLEHVISGLFFFQIPVALMGVFVSLYSREAIVGAHNAIQHVHAITLSTLSGDNSVAEKIEAGSQMVVPKSMSGIVNNAQILVDGGGSCEEIITVSAVQTGSFTATFARAHTQNTCLAPLGSMHLPKIIAGGARLAHTRATSTYYLRLPYAMMAVWIFLAAVSLALCVLSLSARCRFFECVAGMPC